MKMITMLFIGAALAGSVLTSCSDDEANQVAGTYAGTFGNEEKALEIDGNVQVMVESTNADGEADTVDIVLSFAGMTQTINNVALSGSAETNINFAFSGQGSYESLYGEGGLFLNLDINVDINMPLTISGTWNDDQLELVLSAGPLLNVYFYGSAQ